MEEAKIRVDMNVAELEQELGGSTISYREELAQYTTWVLMCLASLCLLCLGIMSLLIKLIQMSFIVTKEALQYDFWEFVSLIGFCNQLWNICDTNKLQMEQIYRFTLSASGTKYTRYMSQNICILDSVIKNQLFLCYKLRGFMIATALNPSLLQKIIVKRPLDSEIKTTRG